MSSLSEHHKALNERGEGKCSVPMWCGGLPAGFCDEPAYSGHKGGEYYIDPYTREKRYIDGTYNGYVPALACPNHGGFKKHEVVNLCNNCSKCIADCDGNPVFGTRKGNDNVYECSSFTPMETKTPQP